MQHPRKTISIVTDAGKRVEVGTTENGVFYKRVKESEHLYVLLDAWGMDLKVFEEVAMGCHQIRIFDDFTGKVYAVHPRLWRQNGVTKEHKPHGKQTFLARKFFTVEDPKLPEAERLKQFLANRRTNETIPTSAAPDGAAA